MENLEIGPLLSNTFTNVVAEKILMNGNQITSIQADTFNGLVVDELYVWFIFPIAVMFYIYCTTCFSIDQFIFSFLHKYKQK